MVKTLSGALRVTGVDVDALGLELEVLLALGAPALVLLYHVLGRLEELPLVEDFLT